MQPGAYVYVLTVDGRTRYVGKGTKQRHLSHLWTVRSIMRRQAAGEMVEMTALYRNLTKAWRDGCEVETEIVADGLSTREALDLEQDLIAETDGLWNTNRRGSAGPGSEAHLAAMRSTEVRRKIGESSKARMTTPEARADNSERLKAAYARPESKARKSAATAAGWRNEETRAKRQAGLSAAATARYKDSLFRTMYANVIQAVADQPGISQRQLVEIFGNVKLVRVVTSRAVAEGLLERRGKYHAPVYFRTNVEQLVQAS